MPIRRTFLIAALAVALIVVPAAPAHAAPVALCVPTGAGAAVTTPQADGACPGGTTKRSLVQQGDLNAARDRIDALEAKLADVTRTTVNGKPTLRISGVNLQLVNGTTRTGQTNGVGNLMVGYNDGAGRQGGSHNIILGRFHAATSWGSLVAGEDNRSTAPSQLLAGEANQASGKAATVAGGTLNTAAGQASTVAGGYNNIANGVFSAVLGGELNVADDQRSSVAGGYNNKADGEYSVVAGGIRNVTGPYAQVTGGSDNSALGYGSAILGSFGITLPAAGGNYQRSP